MGRRGGEGTMFGASEEENEEATKCKDRDHALSGWEEGEVEGTGSP